MPESRAVLLSLLDLSPIVAGGSAAESFRNTLDLARHAERWGYHRFWLAEHHGIPGVGSAATSVLIAYVAGGTSTMRIGAGGIMLPNHPPLLIAEQFGTLESLYPGRIDLGIGRAPGGDHAMIRALRRTPMAAQTFPDDLAELQAYFDDASSNQVRAIPGAGLRVPIYLLGSSDFSARLAAAKGLPFAFASHFAPNFLEVGLGLYRQGFRPSAALDRPHAMVGVNIVAADTEPEARRLFTTLQQQFLNLIQGRPSEIPPPVDSMDGRWNDTERAHVQHMTRYSIVGDPAGVRAGLEELLAQTQADEIIATASIHDHTARLRSFQIAAEQMQILNRKAPESR